MLAIANDNNARLSFPLWPLLPLSECKCVRVCTLLVAWASGPAIVHPPEKERVFIPASR